MKKNNILWTVLPMMAAALMTTACSNDDNENESPAQQSTVKTIPYSVTVNDGATTRATVDSDNKTLKFAAGDKLYITGTNIKGVLDIQSGATTTSATFSGDLTYTGDAPAADLELTATLVSAQQTDGSEITVNATTGAVTVNYPTTAYCADVATAVQKYSNLTGTSTYSAKSFSLAQQTAFLNFEITFEDGTATGTALSAVVNNNSSDICTANVTTTTESTKVVAKFVLPVAKGTTLSSAKVTMGSKAAISFGASQTLEGKVYNVKKTQAAAARALTSATTADVGKIAGADGKIYDTKAAAEAVATGNAIAMIAYVGTASECTTGLAIALEDVSSSTYTWGNAAGAVTTWASGKTAPTTGLWRLPSIKDWQYMFIGCGASGSYSDNPSGVSMSYSELASKLGTAGGTALQNACYWSSTEHSPGVDVYFVDLYYGDANWYDNGVEGDYFRVRACLAF